MVRAQISPMYPPPIPSPKRHVGRRMHCTLQLRARHPTSRHALRGVDALVSLWGRGFPKSGQGSGGIGQGALGFRGRICGGRDFLLASINRSLGFSIRSLFSAKFAKCSLVSLLWILWRVRIRTRDCSSCHWLRKAARPEFSNEHVFNSLVAVVAMISAWLAARGSGHH